MTYAYDDYVQMPTKDLYDTAVMKMAIEAAKDMYDKGQAQMENFYKTYGDFMSPIAKDMQWYGERMNNVRAVVNDAYARGIDLFKSPEGRAIVAQLSHSVDPMQFNMMRQSAENAKEYLKARRQLEANGLYSPLYAKYDGPSLSDYSTLESGIWDKMSPTPIQNTHTFTEPFFKDIKPTIRKESKNGVSYTVSEISVDDLRRVAESKFNDLVNTQQGRVMYNYYLGQSGGDPELAKQMFNNAIVDANLGRVNRSDDYEDNYFKREELKLAQRKLDLTEQRNDILSEANQLKYNGFGSGSRSRSGSSSSSESNKTPVSYYEPMYQNLIINTINNDPHRTSMFGNNEFSTDLGVGLYQSQQNIAEDYFGDGTSKSIYDNTVSASTPSMIGLRTNGLNIEPARGGSTTISTSINKTIRPDLQKSDTFTRKFNSKYNDYLDRLSLDFESGMFAESWNHGLSKVSEVTQDGKTIERLRGKNYVYMGPEDIDKVYSGKELAARAAGVTGAALEAAIAETKRIRTRLMASNNNVMRGSGKMLGVGLSNTGQYGAYARIHVAQYDGNSALSNEEDAYIMTPYQSTPNPNFSRDGRFNLTFDQSFDLSRMNMDNAAIRKLGVSSNTGTIDNTLADPNPWYTMEGLNSFGWLNDDIEE